MKLAILLWAASVQAFAQSGANVLVVVNDASTISRRIGEYYVHKRSIPLVNVCHLKASVEEDIDWAQYQADIEKPIANYLIAHSLYHPILYIVTTLGVPLRVLGTGTTPMDTTTCAVDSELALLYSKMRGVKLPTSGVVPNPLFGKREIKFQHPQVPIYLVTRLAGYDFEDVKGMIDRSLLAQNRGKFVIDLRSADSAAEGNNWLSEAARQIPAARLVVDRSDKVLYGERDVIGYAGWGSNDPNRRRRWLGFQWLPGAIATEFVSTNARTFKRPPDSWNISTWKDTAHFFAGAPQSLTADSIHEGVTGSSGQVTEPYLIGCPRPDFVLPAYFSGRNLAESFYLGIRGLSWQNVVLGDPLCRIGRASP